MIACAAVPARAEIVRYGPVMVDSEYPDYLFLVGPIESETADDFSAARAANPDARVLVLDSLGGNARAGLAIAVAVQRAGLATFISAGASCYSACAKIFLAGSERAAVGELGVHQTHGDDDSLSFGGSMVIETVQFFSGIGVHPQVIARMLQTPPDDIHIFTAEEIADYGIDEVGPVLAALMDDAVAVAASVISAEPYGIREDIMTGLAELEADPQLARALVEDGGEPLADIVWERVVWPLFEALLDPAFADYVIADLARRGFREDGIGREDLDAMRLAELIPEVIARGIARLPADDIETYLALEGALYAAHAETAPEVCVSIFRGTVVGGASLAGDNGFLASLPVAELDAFAAVLTAAIRAEINAGRPLVLKPAQAAEAEAAFAEAFIGAALRSPHVRAMLAVDDLANAPPELMCEVGRLTVEAMLRLDEATRRDVLLMTVVLGDG